ncbi:FUSC family protein [Winogradskyella sp. UBA3174]|uniref:FUSC family protein n=1 Tax=Winogradskyella sp. UBA3174 TaxID=1947785 RepID=UPI0025DCECCE|nr:FUSC family protein [Winogradskyella sp. UBA3174]|tara:strand:+ start:51946 stop:52284 length:339 start_codon:yes stop_codon:yes gene_type:complete
MSKKLFIILGFITAIIAVILAVTPLSNLAILPIGVAFVCGLIVFFISKKQNTKTKTIQYIFLLVIISLGLTIYKGVFNAKEVGNTEELEIREEENLEDSKEILEDIEIDEDF